MNQLFSGKTLLITGGTGSFGSAVLDRFLQSDIKEIRIFSRDEKKQDDMRHDLQAKHPDAAKKVKFYVGDRVWSNHQLEAIQTRLKLLVNIFLPYSLVVVLAYGMINLLNSSGEEGPCPSCRVKDLYFRHAHRPMLLEKTHSCHCQCAEHSGTCHAACDHKNDLPVCGHKEVSLNSAVGEKPQPHKENKSDEPMEERAFRPATDKTAVVHITDLAVCDTIGDRTNHSENNIFVK